jgi:hypothetical protein
MARGAGSTGVAYFLICGDDETDFVQHVEQLLTSLGKVQNGLKCRHRNERTNNAPIYEQFRPRHET